MLITKFHRLIQSKLLWWSFLGIIVLSFVVWGTVTPGQKKQMAANAPGTLDGEPVSQEEFRSAYYNSYLAVIMAMGRSFPITREIEPQLRAAAWQRIVTMKEAEKLGLTVSRDEVANAIIQNPIFHTQDGQFSKRGYKAFITDFLANMGFTEQQFEEHMRQEILLRKAQYVISRSTLVPPYEIRRTFSSISDRFKIEYAVMGAGLVSNNVHVTDSDVKAFYDRNPTAFKLPEMMKVKYVRFAAAPFIAKVQVTPEDVESYYNDHLDEFLADTNAVAADTNLVVASKYKPFEDVKKEVEQKLTQEKAIELASDRAMEFVMDVTPDRDGKALGFEDAAKKYETFVLTTAPFSEHEAVTNEDAGLDFNRAAFALGADPSSAISEPVRGKQAVYVLGYEDRIAPRVPAFDEVKARIRPYAESAALSDALGSEAAKVRDAAAKAVAAGKSFESALASFNIPMHTSDTFTASTGPTTNEYSDLLMRGVMTMNQGEVSELLPANDAILLAYVVQRTPGDPTTFDSLRQQIETTIRRQNARTIFDSWQEYLVKEAKLVEHNIPTAEDEDVEPTDSDSETNNS